MRGIGGTGRRGVFGWFGALLAAPAAAKAHVPEPAGNAARTTGWAHLAPKRAPSPYGKTQTFPIARGNGWSVSVEDVMREFGARRERQRAASCLPPREFAAFMRDRLGDQGMIP